MHPPSYVRHGVDDRETLLSTFLRLELGSGMTAKQRFMSDLCSNLIILKLLFSNVTGDIQPNINCQGHRSMRTNRQLLLK